MNLCPWLVLFLGVQSVPPLLLSSPAPSLLFSSPPFPQFCHINMNLGLQRFRVPQAAALHVCLIYSSVAMETDAWVFLPLPGTFSFSLHVCVCLSPLSSTQFEKHNSCSHTSRRQIAGGGNCAYDVHECAGSAADAGEVSKILQQSRKPLYLQKKKRRSAPIHCYSVRLSLSVIVAH